MKQTKGRQTRDGVEVRRVQVMLDAATIGAAKKLGAGNISAGIRRATKEAAIMKRHQLEAICKMAEATHEYNLGVLCMLGHELLARRHESAAKWVTMLVAQRDMLTPDDASPLDPLPPEAEKVQAEIDAEVRHRNAMWAPIQAIIDEARKALDEADPMGMGQSVSCRFPSPSRLVELFCLGVDQEVEIASDEEQDEAEAEYERLYDSEDEDE